MKQYVALMIVVLIGVAIFANWVGGAIEQSFAKSAESFEVRR